MNLTTAAKRLGIKSPVVVKKVLEDAGIEMSKSGRELDIDDLAFLEKFRLAGATDEMLSLGEAAALLGISVASARNRLCSEGGVGEKIGGSWRVRRSDIEAMLPKPEPVEEAAEEDAAEAEGVPATDEEATQAAEQPATSAETVSAIPASSAMDFTYSLYERLGAEADGSLAVLDSLRAHLAQAIAAWREDCKAMLGDRR